MQNKATWHHLRADAAALVARQEVRLQYNAVVIDEAQDLDPSAINLLVSLCGKPNRVFITADANQSIYGGGFTWADVHHSLRFQGRTAVLHVNYRSTREIGEAAQSYLAEGMLDSEQIERGYVNSGPMPVVRVVRNGSEEVQLLARFLPAAAREFRLAVGACAVLCPTNKLGEALAAELRQRGLEATFMSGRALDLARQESKYSRSSPRKGWSFR